MRKVSRRRNPYARFARTSMVDYNKVKEGRTKDRSMNVYRKLRAIGTEVKNNARAQWRNWEWCMSRVCNSTYQRP